MKTEYTFLKIDYKSDDCCSITKEPEIHVSRKTAPQGERYLVAGGVYNKNRGSLLYTVKDAKEAFEFARNNNLMHKSNFTAELFSEDISPSA